MADLQLESQTQSLEQLEADLRQKNEAFKAGRTMEAADAVREAEEKVKAKKDFIRHEERLKQQQKDAWIKAFGSDDGFEAEWHSNLRSETIMRQFRQHRDAVSQASKQAIYRKW